MSDPFGRPPTKQYIAIGDDGKRLAIDPETVRQNMSRMFEEGELVAIVLKNGDDLSVQVFGPATLELVETFERAALNFRKAVEASRH